jgi:hypothetical protein
VPTDISFTTSAREVPVAEALVRLQAWHSAVAKAGADILTAYRAKGQPIPCEVRARHNAGVSGYLRAARSVFEQLRGKNIPVTQKVIAADGAERTAAPTAENPFPSPVAPLAFVVSDCKGADTGLGIPLPVIMAGVFVGAVAVLMLTRAVSDRITWPGGPPPPYDQVSDAYLRCIKETGDPTKCSPLIPARSDWFTIALVGGLLIAVGVGGILVYRHFSREPEEEAA